MSLRSEAFEAMLALQGTQDVGGESSKVLTLMDDKAAQLKLRIALHDTMREVDFALDTSAVLLLLYEFRYLKTYLSETAESDLQHATRAIWPAKDFIDRALQWNPLLGRG